MAELNIPITKQLEANLALRYDNYSDFGGTWNPKASFRYQPMQELLFRGSYNTGFRARRCKTRMRRIPSPSPATRMTIRCCARAAS